MLTIELISDGPNVFVEFEEPYNHQKPSRVFTSAQAYSLFNRTEFTWVNEHNQHLKYATHPDVALRWLLENGYDAHSEESYWLKTGEWPE